MMLTHTFCHIPRIGKTTERRFWEQGLLTWEDAFTPQAEAILGNKTTWVRQYLEESRQHLAEGDALWFERHLPNEESWRLYSAFRAKTAYLDIETTGLGMDEDHITSIALCGAGEVKTYVYGQNLEEFLDDIRQFSLLVTFNGKCFDVPFLQRALGFQMHMAHVDLRFVMKKIGIHGGLKKIEKTLGLSRDELEGVDGLLAIALWQEYERTANGKALETLLAYNAADVVGLELLLCTAYNKLAHEQTLLQPTLPTLEPAPAPHVGHIPDRKLVDRLLGQGLVGRNMASSWCLGE